MFSKPSLNNNLFNFQLYDHLQGPYLMMSHVSFGAIQKPLELQAVGIPVGDDVANLPNYSGENEHANQIAHYSEHVPVEERNFVRFRVVRMFL